MRRTRWQRPIVPLCPQCPLWWRCSDRSFRTTFGSAIDRRAVGRYQVFLRRLLHVRRRHLVEIGQDRVDPVRVVVVEREGGEEIRTAESAAALEVFKER